MTNYVQGRESVQWRRIESRAGEPLLFVGDLDTLTRNERLKFLVIAAPHLAAFQGMGERQWQQVKVGQKKSSGATPTPWHRGESVGNRS